QWQVSSFGASLAALGPRLSYRDYYRRRGVQIGTPLLPHPQIEVFAAWRGEHPDSLRGARPFSFLNGDKSVRSDPPRQEGRLNALILGASADGGGFDLESLDATYRRHQLDTLFGERLEYESHDKHQEPAPAWRIDWTSEIASPDALGGDFDFRRHVISARYRK